MESVLENASLIDLFYEMILNRARPQPGVPTCTTWVDRASFCVVKLTRTCGCAHKFLRLWDANWQYIYVEEINVFLINVSHPSL